MRSELDEFMTERVLPSRQVHMVDYPTDMGNTVATGVMLGCPEQDLAVVILPTWATGIVHLEMHFFADGTHTDPTHEPPGQENGVVELVLRHPRPSTKV